MLERLLLLVNTASGTGHPPRLVERLAAVLERSFGSARLEIARAADHAQARRLARDFVARTAGRCAVIVGGGNGTVRAAVEGIASAVEGRASGGSRASPAPGGGLDRIVLAALRLGSGNLFAREFGVPPDPEVALRGIVENLRAGRLTRCALVRCEVEDADGSRRTLHATSLVGFGAFGEVPGRIERWRVAHPRLRRLLARLLGIERLNAVEYAAAFALGALRDALSPSGARPLRLAWRGRVREARLVAGAIVKFDCEALPLGSRLRAADPAMALALVERMPIGALLRGLVRPGRLARRAELAILRRSDSVRLERAGGPAAELFLDEDPVSLGRALTFRLSGALPVAPGVDYRWPALPEVAP